MSRIKIGIICGITKQENNNISMLLLLIIPQEVANGLSIGSEYRAWVNWKIKGIPNRVLYYGSPYGLEEKNQNAVRLGETLLQDVALIPKMEHFCLGGCWCLKEVLTKSLHTG